MLYNEHRRRSNTEDENISSLYGQTGVHSIEASNLNWIIFFWSLNWMPSMRSCRSGQKIRRRPPIIAHLTGNRYSPVYSFEMNVSIFLCKYLLASQISQAKFDHCLSWTLKRMQKTIPILTSLLPTLFFIHIELCLSPGTMSQLLRSHGSCSFLFNCTSPLRWKSPFERYVLHSEGIYTGCPTLHSPSSPARNPI